MPYTINKIDSLLKITVEQDTSSSEYNAIISDIASMDGYSKVMLNLHNCYYVQSKVLASMIALKKAAQKKSAEFVLANVNEGVYQVLDMTNLLPYFHIVEDFSSYSDDELIELFFNTEMADKASDYIVSNYNDHFREKLLEALNSNDPTLQYYSIVTFGRSHDYAVQDQIKNYLSSDSGLVLKAVILVLGWFGDVDSKDTIYGYLNSELSDVAEAAAASIALLSDETDSGKMHDLIKSGSSKQKQNAIKALTLINDEKSYEIIKGELAEATEEIYKVLLTKAVSSFNKPEVAEILLSLFDDTSLKVREAAAGGLVRIKAKDKAAEILSKVTDSDSWVGYFAVKALGEIGEDTCAKGLIDKFDAVDENVKLAIIESLGLIKYDSSEFLSNLIDDVNEDVRKEVLSSLFKINKPKAAEAALKLYDSDPSWLVRFKSVDIIGNVKQNDYKELLSKRLEAEDNRYVKDKILSLLEDI